MAERSQNSMNELNELFNNYVEKYKVLDLNQKYVELINTIKELTSFIDALATKNGIELSYLKSNEILDLKSENVTTDDYLEAILVYVENVKHLLGQVVDKMYPDSDNLE